MIKTTRWRPDTCDCVLEYQWDDAVPLAERVHTYTSHVKCQRHAAQGPEVVAADNHRKNQTLGEALERFSALRQGTAGSYELRSGVEFTWSYDESGVLRVSFAGIATLTAPQRNSLQAALDQRFGAGAVLVI